MRIDWWTLGLQTINALVLIWLLSRFLFKPIADIIAERQAAADRLLSEAFEVRIGVEGERDIAEHALAGTAADRAAAISAALTEGAREKAALLETAKAEIDKMRAEARAQIEEERAAEQAALAEQASRLAVEIAAKLIERLPDESRIDGFIEGLAKALTSLPPETKASFGSNGEPVRLAAPRALSDEERSACETAITRALGRPIELRVETDPTLIAGLELEDPHASLRNSFKADLAKIAAELSAS